MKEDISNLIEQTIAETISLEDFEHLQDAILADVAIGEEYLRAVRLSETLREFASGSNPLADGLSDLSKGRLKAFQADELSGLAPSPAPQSKIVTAVQWLSAIAVTVVVAMTIHATWPESQTSVADAGRVPAVVFESPPKDVDSELLYVAKVVAVTPDVVWRKNSATPDFLMRTRRGDRFNIKRGLVELEYYTGARLILHGPCTFVTTGENSGRLEYGHLTGNVEGGNFLLTTPSAQVLDLGTEFGVSVNRESETDVCVFDGEVNVASDLSEDGQTRSLSLTQGMSARVQRDGEIDQILNMDTRRFSRQLPETHSQNPDQLSLVDLLSANSDKRFCLTGVISPDTGAPDQGPWLKADGPGHRMAAGYQRTFWNPYVDGVFIPSTTGLNTQLDSANNWVDLPPSSARTWGPIWSRRKLDDSASIASLEDFWGTMTLSGVIEKLQECEAGMIGIHSNVGVTFDLSAIRDNGVSPMEFRCIVSNLDNSMEKSPKWAMANRFSADFRVFVDGELRASRLDFTRVDGDGAISVDLFEGDRFLTLVSSEADGRNGFDHVVLIDPIIELAP